MGGYKSTARIINGNIASNTQTPWQVALVTNPFDAYQSYICSGSLIADRCGDSGTLYSRA
jgi:secreted trypsin-like serine protease